MNIAMWLAESGLLLAHPGIALFLRVALGSYVIYMARGFYASPSESIRKYMQLLPDHVWVQRMVRGWACFCVWGGCFIIATAFATQVAAVRGLPLAMLLVLAALIATYFVLPKNSMVRAEGGSENDSRQKFK